LPAAGITNYKATDNPRRHLLSNDNGKLLNKQPRAKRVVLQLAPHRGAASCDVVTVIQRSLCQQRSQEQEEQKKNWHSQQHKPRAEHVVSKMK
jgi:hypothetical protein